MTALQTIFYHQSTVSWKGYFRQLIKFELIPIVALRYAIDSGMKMRYGDVVLEIDNDLLR